ncbi:hypothetical protein FQN50_008947 [Emmonsiellopsis sp. PD_5]|nr:hypothetical protein FQN50_008947 [Emmonsiellopsis sp. PD_5]
MTTTRQQFSFEDYTVAIVCALYKELLAVRTLFDSVHDTLQCVSNDPNHYALGQIAVHNVVTTCLPSGEYGTNSAAGVVSHLVRSFPCVQFCLLVGIGGGIPSKKHDIRLGDVVVSHPLDGTPGVVQYDLGKAMENGKFVPTHGLQKPPRDLMAAINNMRSDPNLSPLPLKPFLNQISKQNAAYKYPGEDLDVLFASDATHCSLNKDTDQCKDPLVERPRRDISDHPKVFYGPIASGNQVVKSAQLRDRLQDQYKVLCVEMEGAGIVNVIPSLIIRGICDYADSHKNDIWQEYASAAAASYAKLLLSFFKLSTSKLDLPGAAEKEVIEDRPKTNSAGRLSLPITVDSTSGAANELLHPLKPSQSAENRLSKCRTFARRRPSWEDWPTNGMALFQSLQRWVSAPGSYLLELQAPFSPVSKKRARDLAFEVIDFIRGTTSYRARYTFSLPDDGVRAASDILKDLIFQEMSENQELGSLSTTPTSDYNEDKLFGLFQAVYSQAKEAFVVIETPNSRLTDRFLRIFRGIVNHPNSSIKVLMIYYYSNHADACDNSSNTGLVESMSIPPALPPSQRRSRRKRRTLWRQLKPYFATIAPS